MNVTNLQGAIFDLHAEAENANFTFIGTPGDLATEHPEVPFDDSAVTAFAIIIITFLILGTFGNLLTIIVISRSTKLRNVFNEFILSLCISDLLSALISWVSLHRKTWGFINFGLPDSICVFYWGAEMWTSYVTAQHILSFALLRLISIWRPMLFFKIKIWHSRVWIGVIWLVAFGCGFVPMAIFSGARLRNRTTDTPVHKWPSCSQNIEWFTEYSTYTRYCYPVFFYLPMVSILIVSGAIGIVLGRVRKAVDPTCVQASSMRHRKRKERQAVTQLALIVGSFILGYVPFTAYEYYSINTNDQTHEGWRMDWLFGAIAYGCLRFSETLNPVFYNLASSKMRRETLAFLKQCYELMSNFLCCGMSVIRPKSNRTSTCSTSGTGGLEV